MPFSYCFPALLSVAVRQQHPAASAPVPAADKMFVLQENGKWEGSNFFNDGNCYLNLLRIYNRREEKKSVEAVGTFNLCGIFKEPFYSDLNL